MKSRLNSTSRRDGDSSFRNVGGRKLRFRNDVFILVGLPGPPYSHSKYADPDVNASIHKAHRPLFTRNFLSVVFSNSSSSKTGPAHRLFYNDANEHRAGC